MISVITRNVFGQPGPDFDELLTSEIIYDIDLGLEIEDLSRVVDRVRELWEDEIQQLLSGSQEWLHLITNMLHQRKSLSGDEVRSLRPDR